MDEILMKWGSLVDRGILTPIERATSFLTAFVEIPVDQNGRFFDTNGPLDVVRLVKLLPASAQQELWKCLAELREKEYRWRPLLIGPGYSRKDEPRIAAQTRRLDELLSEQT